MLSAVCVCVSSQKYLDWVSLHWLSLTLCLSVYGRQKKKTLDVIAVNASPEHTAHKIYMTTNKSKQT